MRRATHGAAATSFWHSIDSSLATSAALLTGMGVVVMFSTSAHLDDQTFSPIFLRHASAAGIGALIALGCAFLPLRAIQRLALPFWALCLLMLAATFVPGIGIERNGAQRWLFMPGLGLSFQPVEFAKLATVLGVAALLSRDPSRPIAAPRDWLPPLVIALTPAALLLAQPDFGNAVITCLLTGALLFAAGAPLRLFVLPGIGSAALVGTYIAFNPYAQDRITAFLHAWERSQSVGFQLVQSFVAFARGGLTGVGIGNGWQRTGYLPEVHTDFILSAVGEELGLIGVLVVLGGFVGILISGSRIARNASSRFAMLLAFGCTALIVLPAVINIAVVMGTLPTKGLTLPLLSYGRSSMLASALAIGLLLNVARREEAQPSRKPMRRGRATSRGRRV